MRGRGETTERYRNQWEHPERLVGGFDQMYAHLILQADSLQPFLYPRVQITDDGLIWGFDHEVLLASRTDGFI